VRAGGLATRLADLAAAVRFVALHRHGLTKGQALALAADLAAEADALDRAAAIAAEAAYQHRRAAA
jgi:hypothetical protein